MKAVGLITEYNPFHNGHDLNLKKALNLSGADVSLAVMSGNFVQRGEPAIIDKYLRASMAVEAGVNLVVEMPSRFAVSSAEDFANGGILTLDALNVDYICFGSEAGHLSELSSIADVLASEPDKYQLALKKALREGISFPAAREKALLDFTDKSEKEIHALLASPNNILAIEYLKAIKRHACEILPMTYFRRGLNYNDTFDSYEKYEESSLDDAKSLIPSALAIRKETMKLAGDNDANAKNNILNNMPEPVAQIYFDAFNKTAPVCVSDFDDIFNEKILEILSEALYDRRKAGELLLEYRGFNENLANRLINKYERYTTIEDCINNVKDKSLTYTAISRAIFNFILEKKKSFDDDMINYVRILAMDDKGKEYLSQIRKTVSVPLITKTAGNESILKDDIYVSEMYNLAVWKKYNAVLPDEFKRGVYIKGKGFTGI